MGEKALVESQVSEAILLIQSLDKSDSAPSLAAWYFYDDAEEWRLVIAGPTFDQYLPSQEPAVYRKVVAALSSGSFSSLSVSDVKIVKTDSQLARALGSLIGTGPNGTSRVHFSDTSLNGIFIKEMIVLRSA